MGWTIFAVWLVLGIITQAVISAERDAPERTPEKEKAERRSYVWFWILVAVAAVPSLYLLYWFWYYACCGFLVVDVAETFADGALYTLISLVALVFYGSVIAILFGWWNPRL